MLRMGIYGIVEALTLINFLWAHFEVGEEEDPFSIGQPLCLLLCGWEVGAMPCHAW